MASFPSLYRARAVDVDTTGRKITVFVPQVYGEVAISIRDSVHGLPNAPGMGWVMFQAGNPEFPVWVDVSVSTEGGTYLTVDEANDLFLTPAEGDALFLTPAEGQPLDDDLTAIAALATQPFGRSLLTGVDAAALQALLIPAATIWATGAATADPGWRLCDGSTVTNAQTLYPSLWTRAPVAWRSGANIVLPNMMGRTVIMAGTGPGLTARVLGTAVSNEEAHVLTAAETAIKGHTHGHTISASANNHDTNHYHTLANLSLGGDSPDHAHTTEGDVVTNRDVANRQAVSGAGWYHGITSVNTGGANVRHSHGFVGRIDTVAETGYTSLFGHTITIAGGVTALADGASGAGHNIVQPSYVLNYQIKVH